MQIQANKGFFGKFGGQFVAETLIPVLDEVENAFQHYKNDKDFMDEFNYYLNYYAGRPTPVYFCKNLSGKYGVNIYLKREDLLHTGAHKINNVIGQALLAKYMGKTRVIAETGAGQHGVATATACALFGLECVVYMGSVDVERQQPNVKKMKLLGATVIPVDEGLKTLKDAISAALKDWVANFENTHYCFGTVAGPHPFPEMVAFFHQVTGKEAHAFFTEQGFMPDKVVACVGGGSNAMGIFQGFLDVDETQLIGVEPAGLGLEPGKNAATLSLGKLGIFQGSLSYVLQDDEGRIEDVHSVSAGLDYPGVSPQHAMLKDVGRVRYKYATDDEALRAFRELTRIEGIIPALESSHALAYVLEHASEMKGQNVLVNLSGRGDKDFGIIDKYDLEAL